MTHEITNAKKEIDYDCEVSSTAISDRIAAARYWIMRTQPFYSTLALRQNYIETTELPTAGVDGRNFYYNKNFINSLSDNELIFVFCHEMLHLVFKHLTRRGKRDPQLWNAAADYVINYVLVRDDIGEFPSIGGLYDKQYANMYTEEVYTKLEKEQEENGSGPGRNFDVHITLDSSGDGNGPSDGSSSNSNDGCGEVDDNGDATKQCSAEELEELDQETTSAIIEAVKNAKMMGAGKVPGEVERLIDEYVEAKVDWKEFLQVTAHGQVKVDYDRKKPNRRMPVSQYKVCLPSLATEDHVEFTLAIDTSGSISPQMLQRFVSEIMGIVEQFSSFEVNIWCFDTTVYDHWVITQDNMDDMDDFKIQGGGGTDFMCNWEYMKSIDHVPSTFVMFTDGMPWNTWGDEEYCESIFIIHDENVINRRVKSPFGMTLYMDEFNEN